MYSVLHCLYSVGNQISTTTRSPVPSKQGIVLSGSLSMKALCWRLVFSKFTCCTEGEQVLPKLRLGWPAINPVNCDLLLVDWPTGLGVFTGPIAEVDTYAAWGLSYDITLAEETAAALVTTGVPAGMLPIPLLGRPTLGVINWFIELMGVGLQISVEGVHDCWAISNALTRCLIKSKSRFFHWFCYFRPQGLW